MKDGTETSRRHRFRKYTKQAVQSYVLVQISTILEAKGLR